MEGERQFAVGKGKRAADQNEQLRLIQRQADLPLVPLGALGAPSRAPMEAAITRSGIEGGRHHQILSAPRTQVIPSTVKAWSSLSMAHGVGELHGGNEVVAGVIEDVED